jgi:NAD+ kinase
VLAATVLTPLAPHATFNRPPVLSAGESVGIEVLASSSRLSIEADGQERGEEGRPAHGPWSGMESPTQALQGSARRLWPFRMYAPQDS